MTATRAPKAPLSFSAAAVVSFGRAGSVSLGVVTRSRATQTKSVSRSREGVDEDVAA
jgi:hypothetical protein